MYRFLTSRLGAGAGVAAGAAAATSSNTESHARVRPSRYARVPRSDSEVDARKGPVEESDGVSDDWLTFNFEGDVVNFNEEEVQEGIADIMGIAKAATQHSDDTESIESFGGDADAVIDQSNVVPAGSSSSVASRMGAFAEVTGRLLSKPEMQVALLKQLREDEVLNSMFKQLAQSQGIEMEIVQYPRGPQLPHPQRHVPQLPAPPQAEEDEEPMNPIQLMMRDIGRGFEFAGEHVSRFGDQVGDFLAKIGRWVKSKALRDADAATNEGNAPEGVPEPEKAEKIAGAILCFAGAVMVLLVAKRFGLLRVLREVVA